LHRVKEERNMLHTIQRIKANWIGHIMGRNRFLKHYIEGNIDRNRRRGIRRRQLRDDHQEKRRYWNLKVESPDCSFWRTSSETGCGPVRRQTA
jgi:hypothetical protein